MRVKKLELFGFKSFAEPTEILFEPGITAIVGPNGCGKSNLSEALKWVLGEQSARELRGGRMEDVIFNGTDRREPINYAEVCLTLDNSDKKLAIDYSEVTIARRLFRSGESEYLLNGTQVRLKDINELLMGTGMGTSAYSLFEQGRIEQIIGARPEDRRAVFEEAAGITKFKTQKREAMRRLDETEANLARVSDIILEVKRQVQALERQVRRAKAYQEQFEELKRLEVGLARHSQGQLGEQRGAKEAVLAALRQQMAELEAQVNAQESCLQETRDAVALADARLQERRAGLMGVTHRQETLQHRKEVHQERLQEAERRRTQLTAEIAAAADQIERLQAQMRELAGVVAQADTERTWKENELAQAQAQLDKCVQAIREAEQAIILTQDRLLEESGAQSELKNEILAIRQQATRAEARETRLRADESKAAAERAETGSHLQNLAQALTEAQSVLAQMTQQRTSHRDRLATTQAAQQEARQRVHQLEQEIARVSSQLELLKGLLASHEGYSSGVKTLLSALDAGQLSREGLHGVLAELIHVNPVDTAAVDAALGPWAQAVVVESAAVAENYRRHLEETKAGRVLFLIRDRVPANLADPSFSVSPESTPLIDRITAPPPLEPLLRLLLADTWFIPNRELAWARFSSLGFFSTTVRLVTPAGELFTAASALFGSVPSEESLVVGRRSRLQSLEIALGELEIQLRQARERFQSLEVEHQTQSQDLLALEAVFQERNHEHHKVQATVLASQTSLTKLDQEEIVLKLELADVQQELQLVRLRLQEFERNASSRDQQIHELQATIQTAQQEISRFTKEKETLSIMAATRRTELASFDQLVTSRRASLQLIEQSLLASQSEVDRCRAEMASSEESHRQWEETCSQIELSLRDMTQEETQAQQQVAESEDQKAQALAAAQAQEREFLGVGRRQEQLQNQIHQVEMEQAQLNFQQEQLVTRLAQLYQINLEEAPPAATEAAEVPLTDEEISSMQADAAALSQKLQKMGPVNLGSIEEERELQNRYEYLVTQQADLTKAKEDLHEAITKINRTTRAMFRETFEAIQKEFQETFKQLFGGGEARLILLDEEDVLESGIEIIARPPGKPVQAISLLSGGEKALTTIALLFAIFRIKPSPFCLLDEIDAPLDETNIGRFTGALREFLKDSQFIIITHNKKTISMADVMYGITMAESGVSKIVSVKFKKAEVAAA